MTKETKEILEFAPYRLEPGQALLTCQGEPVSLPPKVFDLLVYMATNAGRLVEKEELLKALWPDSFVEEANLTVNVAALRKALGAQPDGQPWIETVPKRGYRFLGKVARPDAITPPPPLPTPPPRSPRRWPFVLIALFLVFGVGLFLARRHPAPAPGGRQALAVLPFQDLSTDGEDLHAGLGMTDALITRLSVAPELTVRPLNTVRKFEGVGGDPVEQGKAVGADTVLTGSVQRIDKRIRVSVQLLRVQDGQPLWADKFDEFFTNVFAVQDAISEKLAHVLELRLSSEAQDRMMRRYTESTEAYRLYELGRAERADGINKAMQFFKQAIQEDPRYALPYVELAYAYVSLSGNGLGSFEHYAPQARSAVEKAIQLGGDLADSHVASADFKRFVDRDYAGATREIETALRLNPRSARVHDGRGVLLAVQGRLPEAITEGRNALRLDPFNHQYEGNWAFELYCSRQYEEALGVITDFEQRDPRHHDLWNRFYCLLKLSRFDEAIALLQDVMKRAEVKYAGELLLAQVYAAAGRTKEAQDLLRQVPENYGNYQRAVIDAILGNQDDAFVQLNRAVDDHSVWIEWLNVDPSLDILRGDPRFALVVRRMGLTP